MLTKDDDGNIFYLSKILGDSLIKTTINQRAKLEYIQARLWTCGRGEVSTPSFGSHLNPISTREGRLCPPYTGVHTKF